MTSVGSLMGVSAWLTASVSLARDASASLAEVQDRVDSMTDTLSEYCHQLAGDVSHAAMQINMYRSMRQPLPDWTPEQARDPEGTLREFAVRVFQQVAGDDAAMLALRKSGRFFVEGTSVAGGSISTSVVKRQPQEGDTNKILGMFEREREIIDSLTPRIQGSESAVVPLVGILEYKDSSQDNPKDPKKK